MPGTVQGVQEAVREAYERGTPLRIAGRGTWLHGGYPVAEASRLDLAGLAGIAEYVPGDLTLTAHAGTTLAELEAATAAHGQWLPLDPFGHPDGTLGATLATASAGPLGASLGLPRDLTVGIAFVAGNGDLVRAGGRVVKNVAGFDLVRLMIGAWGTLGVIVEATVRLRARPEADETVALPLAADAERLAAQVAALRHAPLEPASAELLGGALPARLGLDEGALLLVRLAGNAVSVRHQRSALAAMSAGGVQEVSPDAWTRLRRSDPRDGLIVRLSRRPSELARLFTAACAIPGADVHASLARGIVRLRFAGGGTGASTLGSFEEADACIVEQAPAGLRVASRPRADAALSDRMRLAFDPRRILNPGVTGEAA